MAPLCKLAGLRESLSHHTKMIVCINRFADKDPLAWNAELSAAWETPYLPCANSLPTRLQPASSLVDYGRVCRIDYFVINAKRY
jgi:hypothetical protein